MAVDSATSRMNRAAAWESEGSPRHRTRSRLTRLVKGVLHAADLQFRVLLLRAQISLRQIVVYTLLLIAAGLAAIAAVVLLSIAAFEILAAHFGTQWTLLIFAAAFLLAAVLLWGLAHRVLHQCASAPGASHTTPEPEAPHDP